MIEAVFLVTKYPDATHTDPGKTYSSTLFVGSDIGQEVNGWNRVGKVRAARRNRGVGVCILREAVLNGMVMPKIIPVAAPMRPFLANTLNLATPVTVLGFRLASYSGLGCFI